MQEFKGIQSESAARHRQLAAKDKSAASARASVSIPKLAKGDAVRLVHANLGHVDATVIAVKGGGRIDIETVDDDTLTHMPLRITNAPFDPDGQQFDSWHKPEPDPSSPPATGGKAA